jgi:SRSO17 transposase
MQVEGQQRAIKDAFETAEIELGLMYNETHSSHGEHRHVSPVPLTSAIRAVIRKRANTLTSR